MSCTVCNGMGRCPVCSLEPDWKKCDACNGTGERYFHDTSDGLKEVGREDFLMLPDDQRYMDQCEICLGCGVVYFHDDIEMF